MQAEILIFKTDISHSNDAEKICYELKKHPFVRACNVALDDSDRILRVESAGINTGEVIAFLEKANFYCEELTD